MEIGNLYNFPENTEVLSVNTGETIQKDGSLYMRIDYTPPNVFNKRSFIDLRTGVMILLDYFETVTKVKTKISVKDLVD